MFGGVWSFCISVHIVVTSRLGCMNLVQLESWGVRVLCDLGLGCKYYGPFVGLRSRTENWSERVLRVLQGFFSLLFKFHPYARFFFLNSSWVRIFLCSIWVGKYLRHRSTFRIYSIHVDAIGFWSFLAILTLSSRTFPFLTFILLGLQLFVQYIFTKSC